MLDFSSYTCQIRGRISQVNTDRALKCQMSHCYFMLWVGYTTALGLNKVYHTLAVVDHDNSPNLFFPNICKYNEITKDLLTSSGMTCQNFLFHPYIH